MKKGLTVRSYSKNEMSRIVVLEKDRSHLLKMVHITTLFGAPSLFMVIFIFVDIDSETESAVVKPSHRKLKSNPNVQTSSLKKEKISHDSKKSEEEDVVGVSYKSKRMAMAEGPVDLGATATLVNLT